MDPTLSKPATAGEVQKQHEKDAKPVVIPGKKNKKGPKTDTKSNKKLTVIYDDNGDVVNRAEVKVEDDKEEKISEIKEKVRKENFKNKDRNEKEVTNKESKKRKGKES